MKRISLLILIILPIVKLFGQSENRLHFIGITPSITVEPYYNSGELDINILPLVYQRTINERIDLRATSILNYGIREGNDKISHFGLETAVPFFFKRKEDKSNLSKGFYLAPVFSFTRNKEAEHSNIGLWIEPGYNLLFDNEFAMSFGLQLGGTYFNYDNQTNTWGNHFGFKIIFGKWI
jgi:hypothetical protein